MTMTRLGVLPGLRHGIGQDGNTLIVLSMCCNSAMQYDSDQESHCRNCATIYPTAIDPRDGYGWDTTLRMTAYHDDDMRDWYTSWVRDWTGLTVELEFSNDS